MRFSKAEIGAGIFRPFPPPPPQGQKGLNIRPFSMHIDFASLKNASLIPSWARANDFSRVPGDWMSSFFVFTSLGYKLSFRFTYVTFFAIFARHFVGLCTVLSFALCFKDLTTAFLYIVGWQELNERYRGDGVRLPHEYLNLTLKDKNN